MTEKNEDKKNIFLTSQIITYMGNKRKLLGEIDFVIEDLKTKMKKDKLTIGDGFSGSGIVSRLLKTKADKLFTNDLAGYSHTLNECYLATPNINTRKKIYRYIDEVNELANNYNDDISEPWISAHWAPKTDTITKNDRAYFTRENGRRIDIIRDYICKLPKKYRPFLLAPLIVESSIHNNTSGQFSAFYKDGEVGAFGGKNAIDTNRITKPIQIPYPIFNYHKCDICNTRMDTNEWAKTFPHEPLDIVYYDPPYNKHPYNIYYFMLDIIYDWNKTISIPDTNRGQPLNWYKSRYNSKVEAKDTMEELIKHTNARYIILSYNDGGIIPISELDDILKRNSLHVEKKPIVHKTYNRLKGISNYKREKDYQDVKEFLYVIKKK